MCGVSWRVWGLGCRCRCRLGLGLRQQLPSCLHGLPAVGGKALGLRQQPELSAPRRVPGLVFGNKVQEVSVLRRGEFRTSTHG